MSFLFVLPADSGFAVRHHTDGARSRLRSRQAQSVVLRVASALALVSSAAAGSDGLPEPRALARDLPTYEAPQDPRSTPPATGSDIRADEPLTLRAALAVALERNPSLAAFSWEIRAREARALQAGLLPNPALDATFEDFGGGRQRRRYDTAETTIRLSQLVELGGKRRKRRRLATLERDLAGWDFETRRLDVFADVTTAFVSLLAWQERLKLAEDLLQVAASAVETVGATVRAGAVSPVEAGRARVARSQAEVGRAVVARELGAARATLAAAMGIRSAAFGPASGELTAVYEPPPPLDRVVSRVGEAPEVARWDAELRRQEAAISLEESRRIPDVTLGPGVRRYEDGGTTALVFGFSVPLPVFDRNQGAILEARRRLSKSRAEQEAAEVAVRGEVAAAYERLSLAFEQVRTLRDAVIPQARAVYDQALEGYQKGLFRYLEVLDAQRTYFEVRTQYVEATAAYHRAATQVERLTGTPLDAEHLAEEGATR